VLLATTQYKPPLAIIQVYVAAFAVSGYASFAHRAKHKPFNPILGETYECIREDRGFKYISEQVSSDIIGCVILCCDRLVIILLWLHAIVNHLTLCYGKVKSALCCVCVCSVWSLICMLFMAVCSVR